MLCKDVECNAALRTFKLRSAGVAVLPPVAAVREGRLGAQHLHGQVHHRHRDLLRPVLQAQLRLQAARTAHTRTNSGPMPHLTFAMHPNSQGLS